MDEFHLFLANSVRIYGIKFHMQWGFGADISPQIEIGL